MKDFTMEIYGDLLRFLIKEQIPVYTIRDWMENNHTTGVVIRHDVDRIPGNSFLSAQLEHELGIKTTYYFRAHPDSYRPEMMKAMSELGHEIGYHYEDLSVARGDIDLTGKLFRKNLEDFRRICPIKTCSMHGRPLSKYDNRAIWDHYNVSDFDLLGEAYRNIDYSQAYYLTDSGRSWNPNSVNMRDRAGSLSVDPTVAPSSTADLMDFIGAHRNNPVFLTTHPERWAVSSGQYYKSLVMDSLKNQAKRMLIAARKRS